jgi:outer membrane protein OmpA-like peptidoglycan-associated protein
MKQAILFVLLIIATSFSFGQNLNLFFDVNKYELSDENKAQLKKLLSRNVTITCIKGYADSNGTMAYNKNLSRKRAEEVFRYLRKNITLNLFPKYLGEEQPAGKELYFDRRVDICFEEKKVIEEIKTIKDSIVADQKKDSVATATEKYDLSNIYFVPDKAIIESWSFYAVDDAAKYLKRFRNCKFEIVGHVNYVLPSSVANNPKALELPQKLSEERAKTVYDLLVERGIPAESMMHKGVGNTQMIYKNPKNDDEKRKNMRVEILIYCNK